MVAIRVGWAESSRPTTIPQRLGHSGGPRRLGPPYADGKESLQFGITPLSPLGRGATSEGRETEDPSPQRGEGSTIQDPSPPTPLPSGERGEDKTPEEI